MSPLTCWLETTDYRDKDWDMRAVARSPPLLAGVFTTKKVWKKLCPGSTSRNKCHLSENCVGQRSQTSGVSVSTSSHERGKQRRVCSKACQTFLSKCEQYTCNKGLFTNDVGIFRSLWHPLVLMSAYHQLLACLLVLQIDDVICEQPWTKNDHSQNPVYFHQSSQNLCYKRDPVEPSETH